MGTLFAPVQQTARGLRTFVAGIHWLRQHPRYLLLLFVPMVVALSLVFFGWGVFLSYHEMVVAQVMFAQPDSWWGTALYYLVKGFVYVAVVGLGLILYVLFVNVLASPVYDIVSAAVEQQVMGRAAEEVSLWESLKLMGEELKKALFVALIAIGLFLIPGINLVAPLITAFLIGWDFYDYPFARRGWRFRRRWRFTLSHGWGVMGLGLWLLIPGLQIFMMPLAVVGGTMLALEDLQKGKQ